MKYLDLTLPTAAANLACDEALLDACEEDTGLEVLRFWEPRAYFVVVGYGNEVGQEVKVEACREQNIPISRRCTGGGTVLQGPGCLNYTLVLQIGGNEALRTITETNRYIMERQREVLSRVLGTSVQVQGHTDLTVNGLKFSGNAQRRKRKALIFHGTFLLDFDLALVEKYLSMPSREPDYRQNRGHGEFLMNLKIPAATIKSVLRQAWSANETFGHVPDLQELIAEKYGNREWNLKL